MQFSLQKGTAKRSCPFFMLKKTIPRVIYFSICQTFTITVGILVLCSLIFQDQGRDLVSTGRKGNTLRNVEHPCHAKGYKQKYITKRFASAKVSRILVHCSLTSQGPTWFRPDREGNTLRNVEHPCHVKRMHNFQLATLTTHSQHNLRHIALDARQSAVCKTRAGSKVLASRGGIRNLVCSGTCQFVRCSDAVPKLNT